MVTGRVVRFDEVRGYGFITPDDGGEDVFVHANDLMGEKHIFTPGTHVEFQVSTGERGMKGHDVRVISGGRRGSSAARPAPAGLNGADHSYDEDGLCDVLSPVAFRQELTEAFIQAAPDLTGAQIVRLRESIMKLATEHGWVEG